jgi:hypothetical protein
LFCPPSGDIGGLGGNFWAGAAAGAFGSITSHGLEAISEDVAKNCFAVVVLSALNGGMGSVMAGGDFFEGAKSGFIVAALNAEGDKLVRKVVATLTTTKNLQHIEGKYSTTDINYNESAEGNSNVELIYDDNQKKHLVCNGKYVDKQKICEIKSSTDGNTALKVGKVSVGFNTVKNTFSVSHVVSNGHGFSLETVHSVNQRQFMNGVKIAIKSLAIGTMMTLQVGLGVVIAL